MNLNQAMKKLGENVQRYRKLRDLTQEQMRDFGFNYRYFQKIEAGEVNATLDTLVKLAIVLKVKIHQLFE